MKIVGLITEYNPFHNGHIYHLEKAKEITGADKVVAVMSGDFVQRGLPAICDKYARTRMALSSGVHAVIELPTYYATSSAERFAEGAVRILEGLGISDIVYGCESGDEEQFKKLAKILCEETSEYKDSLKKYLSTGHSFPAARQKAVAEIDGDLANLLECPNNILAIEYEKVILRGLSGIRTHSILRNDEGYYENGSAIREALLRSNCEGLLPKETIENIDYTVDIEDFADLIFYKLSELSKEGLEEFYEVTSEIATRIKKYEKQASRSVEKLVSYASAKNITMAAIRRALIHVLLDIREDYEQMPYARLLGFNKASGVMSVIKDSAIIPIVTKFADANPDLVEIDYHASGVYNQIVNSTKNITIKDEYHAGVIII